MLDVADGDVEVVGLVLDLVIQLGPGDEGLGGDAAPVQADAAELVTLDTGHAEAQLGGADGGDVAGGAAADDDEVEVLGICHGGEFSGAPRHRGP